MNRINSFAFISAAALMAGCSDDSGREAVFKKSPNVIFILADDLGIGDLGCYGQRQIKTPNIDKLASDGMLFTRHYSGSTVSAPSRCALLTGKHTGHSYIRGNKGITDEQGLTFDYPLPENEVTVAEIFGQAGYATACVGKWGLGGPETTGHPNNQGFDYFYGYLGQARAHRYYPDFLWENGGKAFLDREYYSPDLIADKALEFISLNRDNRFFLYFTPTIPHADIDIPDPGEYRGMFQETPFVNRSPNGKGYKSQPEPRAAYAAMVGRLDSYVGRIVSLLEKEGILDNTIIIFSSDNGVHSEGGHDPAFFNSNGGFRGQKRDLYEGGIRTPFIVSCPSVVEKGSRSGHVSAFWDFLPTMCDIVGVEKPHGTDGISYLPALTGKGRQKKHDHLYYEFHERGGRRAVIKNGWKLVELNVYSPEASVMELYDLENDPSESANLIAENPALARRLRNTMLRARTHSGLWDFAPSDN